MAKRLSDEKPYTPFEGSLVASVLAPPPPEPEPLVVQKAEPVRKRIERLTEKSTPPRRSRRPSLPSSEQTQVRATPVDDAARSERVRPAPGEERMTATLRLQTAVRDKREFEAFVARLAAAAVARRPGRPRQASPPAQERSRRASAGHSTIPRFSSRSSCSFARRFGSSST